MATGLQPGFYYSGDPNLKYLTHEQWAALAESKGLPGETFADIVDGEAGGAVNIQQRDPGDGMVGYGGVQATPNAWGKGTPAAKELARLGGISAMADPSKALDMAAFLFKAAGNSISPWYGTKYVEGPNQHYAGNLKPEDFLATTSTPGATSSSTSTDDGGGGMFAPLFKSATKALLWIGLILGGAALVVLGAGRLGSAASGQKAGA